ncbi:hypothetical protein ACWFNE_06770 [Cellulomonas sp. NPDC055163]
MAEHLSGDDPYVDWAVVALFYSAHQWVHSALSGEPTLAKDERHPRKHSGGPAAQVGGRGTNQIVAALFPEDVQVAYRSLDEMSRRTRYDMDRLQGQFPPYLLMKMQFEVVRKHCHALNSARPDIPTQHP